MIEKREKGLLFTKQIINSTNDYVAVLDLEKKFINVNHSQIAIMGYSSEEEIIDNTYHHFKGIQTKIAEEFISQDNLVIQDKQSLRYLSYQKYNDGKWHLLLGDKGCIFDEKHNPAGILSIAKDVTDNRLIDLSQFIFDAEKKYSHKVSKTGFNYIIKGGDTDAIFSKKEMLVIFFFLRGKTAREIANIVSRTERTIIFHLETIKAKCRVSSKSLLIEKLIHEGYLNILPEEIFTRI